MAGSQSTWRWLGSLLWACGWYLNSSKARRTDPCSLVQRSSPTCFTSIRIFHCQTTSHLLNITSYYSCKTHQQKHWSNSDIPAKLISCILTEVCWKEKPSSAGDQAQFFFFSPHRWVTGCGWNNIKPRQLMRPIKGWREHPCQGVPGLASAPRTVWWGYCLSEWTHSCKPTRLL